MMDGRYSNFKLFIHRESIKSIVFLVTRAVLCFKVRYWLTTSSFNYLLITALVAIHGTH